MHRGYVKVYRKVFYDGYLKKPKLWALMTYIMFRAAYIEKTVLFNGQKIHLKPGELIFGRRTAARDLGQTEREIRTRLNFLKTVRFLTHQMTHRVSIIKVINWPIYQGDENENAPLNDQIPSHLRPTIKKDKKEKNKDMGDFHRLKNRYDSYLIEQMFEAFRSTRKTKKISQNILIRALVRWKKHPCDVVERSMRIYLKKGCAEAGKDESYFYGIVRKEQAAQESAEKKQAELDRRCPMITKE